MTSETNNSKQNLERLADKLIDDLYQTSNEDLMLEGVEDFNDISKAVNDVKNLWQKAKTSVGKKRLLEAKEELQKKRKLQTDVTSSINVTDIAEARKQFVEQVFNEAGYNYSATLQALAKINPDAITQYHKDMKQLLYLPHYGIPFEEVKQIYSEQEIQAIQQIDQTFH